MPDRNDDFYIGYKPRASRSLARAVRSTVLLILVAVVIVGFFLAHWQRGFSDAVFEWGNVREFEGLLTAEPYPVLHLGAEPHLLVDVGKRGVSQELAPLDGRRVRASGQLIYRDEGRMIELTDRALEVVDSPPPMTGEELPIGRRTLIGEIVDTKCYLGVMKPGSGKPHRSCAARCISGGVPPALLVKGSDGLSRLLVLSDDRGGPLGKAILGLVAQPVSVTGAVSKRDGLWYMQVEPSDIRLWPGDEE